MKVNRFFKNEILTTTYFAHQGWLMLVYTAIDLELYKITL